MGKRVNTREWRYRKRLEEERHKLIEKAIKVIPNYHPPSDYRRPTKTQEKVYVPVNDYPEINFSTILTLRVVTNLLPFLYIHLSYTLLVRSRYDAPSISPIRNIHIAIRQAVD